VGSSKAANRAVSRNQVSKLSNQDTKAVNRVVNKVVSRNRVSKLRRPDAKAAVSKAVVANKADNKAVSRAHKIAKLSFGLSRKRNPPVSRRGIFIVPVGDQKSGPESDADTGPLRNSFQPVRQG
jgi:hypothetical protein